MTDPDWSRGLQQVLLLFLILGRWVRPKGKISRTQLSELLLVYVGTSADILEFSTEGFQMEQVMCNKLLITCVLSIWSWSLLQFTLNLTVTIDSSEQNDKCNHGNINLHRRKKQRKPSRNCRFSCMCCETEVWAILVSMVMQDIPFLAMRVYLLLEYDVINQAGFFFTCKNVLVLLLQLYRLYNIVVEYYRGKQQKAANVTNLPGDVIYAVDKSQFSERDEPFNLQNPVFIISARERIHALKNALNTGK